MSIGYERAAKEIIPAIRSAIAKELKNKYKIKEEEIAKYLGIAQAAVSKYISGKYSKKVSEIEEMLDKKMIEHYAGRIFKNEEGSVDACVCTICNKMNPFDCRFSKAENLEMK